MTQRIGNSGNGVQEEDQVVNLSQVREQKLEEKRRSTERVFFKNLISVYSVTGNSKLLPIELIEVSEDGCSFQVSTENAGSITSTEIPVRLYFSQDTYLEVTAKIIYSRPSIDGGQRYVRFGCQIDTTLRAYSAYREFVRFLKLYSEHAHQDKGDVTLFYL